VLHRLNSSDSSPISGAKISKISPELTLLRVYVVE
jgi:hypothetical protein